MTGILGRIKRNWGWVVTVSAALIFIVVHGFLYSFGLLMVELMEEFDSDVTTTGYVGTVAYGCTWIFCIIATPIVGRIGFRPAVILGVFICSASVLISSFMPGILPLFGSYSLLFAVGNSLVSSGTFLGIMAYFPIKHTTLAFGISTAGVNTGILVFNPLMYAMMSRWGWRSALRIVCAMFLTIALPCTMVFIPPSSPWISHDDDDDDDKVQPRSSNLDGKSLNGVCDEKKTPPKDDNANRRCLLEDSGTRDESHPPFAKATDRNASEVKYIPLDGDGKERLSLMELEQGAAGEEGGVARTRVQCGDWLRLLSYPDVFLLGIGILLGSMCLSFLYFSTANFIVLAGFSKRTASLMMSTMGLAEIVGKLIIGVVADRIPVPKIFYMVAANCIGAGIMYASFFGKTEAAMYAIAAVEGCFVMAPLDSLAHTMANQLYAASFSSLLWSYVMFACGVGGILAAVCGESVDKTGSYNTALYVIIGVFFTAALFLVLVPVYQRAFCKDRCILFKNVKRLGNKKADDNAKPTVLYENLRQEQQMINS
eukprot:XP_011679836.1 PREDICTED: monocarboxylate transporter 10 [Strongylocentrotus purpuratus]